MGQTGSYQAVRWDSYGTATDLGSLGGRSNAYEINDGGWAVGFADTSGGDRYATLWIGNTIYNLNALLGGTNTLTLYEARGINGSGQIVGSATDQGGSYHAFLLTLDNQDPGSDPPPDPAEVPEPSTLALLSSSVVLGVGLLRRRRKA